VHLSGMQGFERPRRFEMGEKCIQYSAEQLPFCFEKYDTRHTVQLALSLLQKYTISKQRLFP
jgi:hypothetical protein